MGKGSSSSKVATPVTPVGGFAPNTFLMQMFGPNASLPQRSAPVGFDNPALSAQIPQGFTPGSQVLPESPAQIDAKKKVAVGEQPPQSQPGLLARFLAQKRGASA